MSMKVHKIHCRYARKQEAQARLFASGIRNMSGQFAAQGQATASTDGDISPVEFATVVAIGCFLCHVLPPSLSCSSS
jgi:hypothetical protein